MEFAFAAADDRAAVRALWELCFDDCQGAYTDTFFSRMYKPEGTVVAKDEGAVIGSLQFFPHTLFVQGQKKRSMYIGGVDVLPAYRRRGVARGLMEFAEAHMRAEGIAVSFLVPVSAAIYRNMGYSGFSYLSEFSGPVSALAPFVLTDSPLLPLSAPPVDAYAAFAAQFPAYLERDAHRFTNEILPLSEAECFTLADHAGYILCSVRDGVLQGLECAYRGLDALRRILGFIYTRYADCEAFCLRMPADGAARKLLCETTIRETRQLHAMAKSLEPVQLEESMGNYINMLGWF